MMPEEEAVLSVEDEEEKPRWTSVHGKDLLIKRLSALPKVDTAPFLARLKSLHEIDPSALRGMGLFLLETTFSAGVNSGKRFRRSRLLD